MKFLFKTPITFDELLAFNGRGLNVHKIDDTVLIDLALTIELPLTQDNACKPHGWLVVRKEDDEVTFEVFGTGEKVLFKLAELLKSTYVLLDPPEKHIAGLK